MKNNNRIFPHENLKIERGGVFNKFWAIKKEIALGIIDKLNYEEIYSRNAIDNFEVLDYEYAILNAYWENVNSRILGDNSIELKILEVIKREYEKIRKTMLLEIEIEKINLQLLGIMREREHNGWLQIDLWLQIAGWKISVHHILKYTRKSKALLKQEKNLQEENKRNRELQEKQENERYQTCIRILIERYLADRSFNTRFPCFGKLLYQVRNVERRISGDSTRIENEISDIVNCIKKNILLIDYNITHIFFENFLKDIIKRLLNSDRLILAKFRQGFKEVERGGKSS